MLLTERNVKSKCKHISDLKTKPHPEQKHAEAIARSPKSSLMASQLENECVKRRKEKKRAERLANAELTFSFAQRRADDLKIRSVYSGEAVNSPETEILTTLYIHTFHYVLIAFIAFLRFDISSERLKEHTKMGNSHFCDFLLQRCFKT